MRIHPLFFPLTAVCLDMLVALLSFTIYDGDINFQPWHLVVFGILSDIAGAAIAYHSFTTVQVPVELYKELVAHFVDNTVLNVAGKNKID